MGTNNNDDAINRTLINGITPISNWVSANTVFIEEFFLTKTGCPAFYELAMKRYNESLTTLAGEPPIEQLSPKGIALLSYIHSEKEKIASQPLMASDENSLIHIIKLVRDAPSGTKVTVIYQPTDSRDPQLIFPRHKTVFKLDKIDNELRIVNLDSMGPVFGELTLDWIKTAIFISAYFSGNSWNERGLAGTRIRYFSQEALPKPTGGQFNRQQDDYQCGIFAIKDARQMMREPGFVDNLESRKIPIQHPPIQINSFKVPARYYKSVQSRQFSEYLLPTLGDEIVTKKGNTLRETHEKHHVSQYVSHFSKKYREQVTHFVQTHEPNQVKMATLQFDAATMTAERLVAIYGPQQPSADQSKQLTNQLHTRSKALDKKPPRRP